MSYFIGLFLLLSIVFSLCFFTKQRFELLFPLTNLSLIVVLYVFGLFNGLFYGGCLVLGIALVLLTLVVILSVKNRTQDFLKLLAQPSVIVFFGFAVFQYIALYFMQVVGWDELTHWGLVVKNMFFSKNFGGGAEATTMFKGYPVGTSLYLYFFEMFGSEFEPAHLFMAMNLINIGFLLPVISKFQNFKQKVLGSLLILSCALLFNVKMYFSIWNDMFLSVLFAYILISYFCFEPERISWMQILSVCLGGFVLTAAKSTGIAFVLFALILIAVDVLVHIKREKKAILKGLLFLSLFVFSICLSKLSWNLYLEIQGVGDAWDTNRLTLSNLIEYVLRPNDFQKTVTKSFWMEFLLPFRSTSNNSATPIPYIIVLAVLGILLRMLFKRTQQKKRIFALGIGIFGTFFIYVISMLISFLFTFSQEEALHLSSYVRYLNTFVIAVLLLLISMLISSWRPEEKSSSRKLFVTTLALICTLCVIVCPIFRFFMNRTMQPYQIFAEGVRELEKDDKIYAVSIGHDRFLKDYLYFRFLATPNDCSGLKIGGSPYIGDVWNPDMTQEDTLQAIYEGGYTRIYLHRFDDTFVRQCANLFEEPPREYTFYRLNAEQRLIACEK